MFFNSTPFEPNCETSSSCNITYQTITPPPGYDDVPSPPRNKYDYFLAEYGIDKWFIPSAKENRSTNLVEQSLRVLHEAEANALQQKLDQVIFRVRDALPYESIHRIYGQVHQYQSDMTSSQPFCVAAAADAIVASLTTN